MDEVERGLVWTVDGSVVIDREIPFVIDREIPFALFHKKSVGLSQSAPVIGCLPAGNNANPIKDKDNLTMHRCRCG